MAAFPGKTSERLFESRHPAPFLIHREEQGEFLPLQGCCLKIATQSGQLHRVFDVPGKQNDPAELAFANQMICFLIQARPRYPDHKKLPDVYSCIRTHR
jgi:hypothetical protein